MKRVVKTVILGIVLSVFMPVISLAGWEKDNVGWWYKHQDGTYTRENWEQIEGKYYYFDGNGYMLHDTKTPDGYMVGSDGAWIESIAPAKKSVPDNMSIDNTSASLVNSESSVSGTRPDIVTQIYHSPKNDDDEKKSSKDNKSSKSKYEKIYDKYKKKIEKNDGDVDDLAELCSDGISEMAEVCVENGMKDYKTYEKWALKLEKVYEKKAGKKILSSFDYSSFF